MDMDVSVRLIPPLLFPQDDPMIRSSLEIATRETIQSFAANPSMRSLTLDGSWWKSHMWRILAVCTPNLISIALGISAARVGPLPSASDFPREPNLARPNITHLELSGGGSVSQKCCVIPPAVWISLVLPTLVCAHGKTPCTNSSSSYARQSLGWIY